MKELQPLSFFHPQSNSLPANILHKIAISINEADYDEDIKVIILKSGGDRAFCAEHHLTN